MVGRYYGGEKKFLIGLYIFGEFDPNPFSRLKKKKFEKGQNDLSRERKTFSFSSRRSQFESRRRRVSTERVFLLIRFANKKKTTTEPRRTSTDKTKPLSQNFVETSESSDRVGFFAAKSETVILPIFDNFWTLVTSAWNKQKTTAADVIDWIVAIDLYRSLFSSVFFKVD